VINVTPIGAEKVEYSEEYISIHSMMKKYPNIEGIQFDSEKDDWIKLGLTTNNTIAMKYFGSTSGRSIEEKEQVEQEYLSTNFDVSPYLGQHFSKVVLNLGTDCNYDPSTDILFYSQYNLEFHCNNGFVNKIVVKRDEINSTNIFGLNVTANPVEIARHLGVERIKELYNNQTGETTMIIKNDNYTVTLNKALYYGSFDTLALEYTN